jgi:hypothetical protein
MITAELFWLGVRSIGFMTAAGVLAGFLLGS